MTTIFLIGPMGAGKTSLGKKLASLLHLQFVDADQRFEEVHNCSIRDFFAQYGEKNFRQQESILLNILTNTRNMVLATGGGSILDMQNIEYLHYRGLVCYLKVSPEQQVQRLNSDLTRPLLPTLEYRLDFFKNMYKQRNHIYESIADIVIDTDNSNIEVLSKQLAQSIRHYEYH